MMKPQGTTIETLAHTPDLAIYKVPALRCDIDNAFMVPSEGYTIVSFQVVGSSGTLSTGTLSLIVTNELDMNTWATSPTAATLSAPGITAGVDIKHFGVGVSVTTVQTAVTVDVYLFLKRVPRA
jgi:hypothetical protein